MRGLDTRISLLLYIPFLDLAFFRNSSSSSLSMVKSTVSADGLFEPVLDVNPDFTIDFGKSSVIISKRKKVQQRHRY